MLGFRSIDRVTKKLTKTIPYSSPAQISESVDRLWADHKTLKYSSPEFRAQNLIKLHDLLEDHKDQLAQLIHSEMGKTIDEAKGEIGRCVQHTKHFVHDLHSWASPRRTWDPLSEQSFAHFLDSQGVLFKIAPFNFPLWLGLKFAIPNIALGNSVMIRPPQTCPRTAELLLEETRARDILGLDFIFNRVEDTESIIQHPLIKGR